MLMMPLNPRTIGTGRPETKDGRKYPAHLKAYHRYDKRMLPIVNQLGEGTPSQIAAAVQDRRMRVIVPRWMASAEWRSLIERTDRDTSSPRTYRLTAHGRDALAA